MKAKLYNQNKEEVGEIELAEEIFNVKMNSNLVHQIVLSQQSNRRQKIAKVKGRGEVRGGGKKPWRQKGTGRARHGSIRSPLWKGGGVTFGPTAEKNYKKKIPAKMRRKALFMLLSAKLKENFLLVVDNFDFDKPKTKEMAVVLQKLFLSDGSGLIVLPNLNNNLILSIRNIPRIASIQAKDLNVLDMVQYKYIVILKEAIKVIENTFLNSK